MEKAVLVAVDYDLSVPFKYSIEELKNLAEACNIEPIYTLTQNMDRPTANYYIGTGKIDELKLAVESLGADIVIFNCELSPSHIRNIEEYIECKVIDRTVLILDIFAKRAKTKEAMLQVEIAQLKYMLPRLIGMTSSLSRQQGGVGSRGPGEKKLELDRRHIETQISRLEKELKDVVKVRQNQRKKRHKTEIPTVALVGYTNAGKSSFMNRVLTEQNRDDDKLVFEKDMLFATLETTSRKITFSNRSFILTDTVGFVSDLPHHLVNSFKSTLEEVTEADLLVHVVDASNKDYEQQIKVTNDVIKSLGAGNIPMIYAFNKIDQAENFISSYEDAYYISCKTGFNFNRVLEEIQDRVFSFVACKLEIPFEKGNIFNEIKETANVLHFQYTNNGIEVECELTPAQWGMYKEFIIE